MENRDSNLNNAEEIKTDLKGKAKIALILGIIGLAAGNLVCAVLAYVFGTRTNHLPQGRTGKILGLIGIIVSLVALVVTVIVIILLCTVWFDYLADYLAQFGI